MSKLRALWLCVVAGLVAACAGGGGGRTSANDAAVANMNLGAGYLQQGRVDLAIERLQRALEQNPRLVLAHSTIALAYDRIGELELAETHYRRATQLAPNSGAAANAYAVFLCSRYNRWRDAEPYFRRAVADTTYATPEAALTNAGVCARDAGDTGAAAEYFRAALARSPSFADALLNMMQLSYDSGNFLQARAFVQRYLDAHPPTAAVLAMCVNVERELNDQAAVNRCAAQLRSSFAGSPELQQIELQQGRDGR
jgi:type IV pilus assembly protein PilF